MVVGIGVLIERNELVAVARALFVADWILLLAVVSRLFVPFCTVVFTKFVEARPLVIVAVTKPLVVGIGVLIERNELVAVAKVLFVAVWTAVFTKFVDAKPFVTVAVTKPLVAVLT